MRAALIAIGTVLLAAVAVALLLGAPARAMLVPGVFAALLLVGTLFERRHYKPLADEPPTGPGWRPTEERFADPTSGALITVYHNARTGERRYVRTGRT